jgi:putative ABC transport system permease protein
VHEAVYLPAVREASAASLRDVRQIVGLHQHFTPDNEPALWFFDSSEMLGPILAGLVALRVFVAAAGAITLFVGAVGVMNIMLVVVSERRREIGLRKAVGATSRAIFVQFLAEAVAVSTVAALAGSALGLALTRVVEQLMPEGSPLHSVPVSEPATVLAIAGSLIGVGLVAGVAPALRAARVAPADALRSH